MRDFSEAITQLSERVDQARVYLKIEQAHEKIKDLDVLAQDPDLWNDQDKAREVTTELSSLKSDIDLIEDLSNQVSDIETLHELAREAQDNNAETEVEQLIKSLEKFLDQLELRSLFIGEYDERDAICSINSGAGGTEACDWADMLFRMYMRWAEKNDYKLEVEEFTPGEEVGISSVTFSVKGKHAYGMLLGERGVHRLVRISPFDSQNRRHTSFASFDVVPALEESESVEIDDTDIRIDTYRASGAGGQHVNKTDSAVRITHLPTGIVVQCQNQRSQIQNKSRAMQMLQSKLAELERQQRQEELSQISGEKMEVGWGSQVRSYVLAPYQLIRDERTKMVEGKETPIFETGNVNAVLDGEINEFMAAFLQWRRSKA